jgi:hypothetical protein
MKMQQTYDAIEFIQSHTKINCQVDFSIVANTKFCMWPGIQLMHGKLRINPEIAHVGDLLHEAGHLAVTPLSLRETMSGDLSESSKYLKDLEREMAINDRIWYASDTAATGWGLMACLALNIDLYPMFENGFEESGSDPFDLSEAAMHSVVLKTSDQHTTELFYLGMISDKKMRTPIVWDISDVW